MGCIGGPWLMIIDPMRFVLISINIVFISSQIMADEAIVCPDRGNDPDEFCLVGIIWSEQPQ